MKKILSMLLSLSMIISSMTMMSVSAEETETVAEETNIVWIGGSYAAGAGHGEKTDVLPEGVTAMPFAKQVTNWIAENSEGTVNYHNVAIGGTQSTYGRNRFEKDVLSKNPDIVFIEFTGNDDSLYTNRNRVSHALEGMVRAVQNYEKDNNKDVKIAFLYRPWFSSLEGAMYNLNRDVIDVYHAIADYYDVYEIDAAEEAKKLWEADGVEYSSMISEDRAHPTALGHYYTGKAMINILEKNPITDHKYRSLPLNVEYTEISPVYIDASDEGYIDSENTKGFTADGTNMVSESAGDVLVYNFKGTSIGVISESVSAMVKVYVDDVQLTNFSSGTAQALAHTQVLTEGEHTLKIENTGGKKVTINNIVVDGIANAMAEKKDVYERGIYEDTCMSVDALEGRTLTNTYIIPPKNVSNYSGLYYNDAIGVYAHALDKRIARYQLSGTTGFGENSNITNVDVNYIEYTAAGQKTARKDFVVRAIDKDNNVLKIFDSDDCIYELDSTDAVAWKRLIIKVYNVPANATGIEIYVYNASNVALTNVKIAYSDIKVDGISLDLDKKWVPVGDDVETITNKYTNNGQKEALGEGDAVSYTSSDNSVATVDENGVITGVSEGFAVITATAEIDDNTYTTTKVVSVKNMKDYTDTEPKGIPENLIADKSKVFLGSNSKKVTLGGVETVDGKSARKLTRLDGTTGNAWNIFDGAALRAKGSVGQSGANATWVNFDAFTPGVSYVFETKVKNAGDDLALVPYVGNAVNKGIWSESAAVGSNEYGKVGMAVESTEWTDYKSSFVFPENSRINNPDIGSVMYWGIHGDSPVNSAVYFSTDDLYLAEEVANDIKFTAENDEAVLAQDGTLKVKAEVVNQIGIPGTLDQTVEWAVVSEDRIEVIENIKTEVSGNTIILSCDDTLPLGRYTLVVISDKYDITKGWEFDVVVDMSVKYRDYQAPEMPANLITSPNVLNNSGGNAGWTTATDVGYKYTVNEKTTAGAWNVFAPSALIAKNSKGSNTPVNLDYYKAGTTYVYKAKVKNASEDSTLTPYYGIAIPAKNDYSYNNAIGSNEYGKDGMPITSTEWTEFKATITFPEKWNEASTDAVVGQKIFAGVGKKSDVGSAVIIDTTVGDSLYLAEEVLYDISNEVVSGETTINKTSSLTLKSELTNQIGLKGGLNQDVTWLALSADRKEIIDSIIIAEDEETGFATVSVTENTPLGNYVILAYSEGYKAAKGIEITVADKKESKATLMLSQDSGYVWLEADVFDAECEKVTFIIAAYSKDENGKLTLLKVKTQQENVTDGVAGIEELWLDDYEEVPTGTIVKAFAWESDSQKPIIATDGSIKEFIIE